MREQFYEEQADVVSVHAGFPNPAADSSLQALDLNQLLINHSASTYLMRIDGNLWQAQGVFAGDIALIDRALDPRPTDPVVWWHDGAFALTRFQHLPQQAVLWGVVTTIIHQLRSKK